MVNRKMKSSERKDNMNALTIANNYLSGDLNIKCEYGEQAQVKTMAGLSLVPTTLDHTNQMFAPPNARTNQLGGNQARLSRAGGDEGQGASQSSLSAAIREVKAGARNTNARTFNSNHYSSRENVVGPAPCQIT